MMKRDIVRWLIWAGLVAGGAFVALAASLPLWLKPLAEWQASKALGRPVTMAAVQLQIDRPWRLKAQDLTIGNPGGFATEPPLLRLPHLSLQFDVWASLRRRTFIVTDVELASPLLQAVALPDGRTNYAGFEHLAGGAAAVDLGAVHIIDGRARVFLGQPHAELELTFTTQKESRQQFADEVLLAEVRGSYAGRPISAHLVGGAARSLLTGTQPWPFELELQNGLTHAALKGMLRVPLDPLDAGLDLHLAGPDMALLEPLSGVPFPTTPPYDLRGRLNYADGVYRVTDAAGRVGHSDLQGSVSVDIRSERPQITADVHSNSVDLRDIAGLLGGEPGPPDTPGQTPEQHARAIRNQTEARSRPRVLTERPIRLAKLASVDVRLDYRAERIQGRDIPFDNMALHMDAVDGTVRLHPLRFGVGRGQMSASVVLSPAASEAVQARAEVELNRVELGHLMRAGSRQSGSGALNGTAHAEGVGRSLAELLESANGAATLWMSGGEVRALLADLAGLRLGSALVSSLFGPSHTAVECFIADLALRRGSLSTQTLLLETEDAVAEGTGLLDLRRERIELRLRTESKRLTVGVLPAPLLISGTLKDPQVAPDPASPAQQGGIAGILAALPTVQLGIGNDPRCERLLERIRRRAPAAASQNGGSPAAPVGSRGP
jgi:AsmA family protein